MMPGEYILARLSPGNISIPAESLRGVVLVIDAATLARQL